MRKAPNKKTLLFFFHKNYLYFSERLIRLEKQYAKKIDDIGSVFFIYGLYFYL